MRNEILCVIDTFLMMGEEKPPRMAFQLKHLLTFRNKTCSVNDRTIASFLITDITTDLTKVSLPAHIELKLLQA